MAGKKYQQSNVQQRKRFWIENCTRKIKITLLSLLSLALIVSFIWIIGILKNPQTLVLRQIKVTTTGEHLDIPTLKKIVRAHLYGGFFSLDAQRLKQALLAHPWVAEISLRRIWPDLIEVGIKEQRPIARWEKKWLITTQGRLFKPSKDTIPPNLPLLIGPNDQSKQLLEYYQRLTAISSPMGIKISQLRLSDRHTWSMVLNDHIHVILGRHQVIQRFQRFLSLYPKVIRAHEANVERIDLRYPNGFSVGWKKKPKSHR